MATQQNVISLGEEKISKLMLRFSIPCILSQLVSSLYNIVDQIFIGNSALGNAATGIVFPVFIIAQAFAWCFGDGCAAYLNICQGKNDYANAHKAIGSRIILQKHFRQDVGDRHNYDLVVNSSIGLEEAAEQICAHVASLKKDK